jgi:hypothetical protein
MKHKQAITMAAALIAALSAVAAVSGILSTGGAGRHAYETIRGRMVVIYGEGVYRDMSVECSGAGNSAGLCHALYRHTAVVPRPRLLRGGLM